MRKYLRVLSLFTILALLSLGSAIAVHGAGLVFSPMFSNNMILQRNMAVPVFGTANAGASVSVSYNGQNVSTTAAADGTWRVNLTSMPANATPSNMVITSAGQTVTFTGVQVGEIWLYSGQSNMHFALTNAIDGPAMAADAVNHNIRLLDVTMGVSGSSGWQIANATTAGNFSAIGYSMGHELSHILGVPIGLIKASDPGTPISYWTHAGGGSRDGQGYDKIIKPLQPYAIRGACWYQGEDDAHFGPEGYYDKLVGLINEWRTGWGQDFTFQIGVIHFNGTGEGWASVRDDQLKGYLTVNNTGIAMATDLTTGGGHPPTKLPIGYRFSLSARAKCYGESNLVFTGPIRDPNTSTISGNKIIVRFTNVGGGLVTGSAYQPGGAPVPFMVAGANGVFYTATATIVGNTVEVSSPSVPNPVTVRYIWNYGQGNLYNTEGLPAFPFTMTLTPGGGDTQAPTAPTNLSATAVSSSQINLSWTASTDNVGVTGYQIFRGGVQVGTTSGTTYSDNGLAANTTYSYYVKAYDAANNVSAQNNTASATTQQQSGDTQAPTAPANLAAAAASSSQINLTWTASTDNIGVTGYQIFRSGMQVGTSSTTSYSDTGLSANTTYSYYVKAYDAAVNVSAQSNAASATTQAGGGSTVIHVADIWTCDGNGNAKGTFVRPETVYWKVKIVDASGNPVSGVTVTTELYRPGSSSVWTTKSGTTDAAGIATMNIGLVNNSATGTYTIKISAVTKSGWSYDSAANVKSQTTFIVQ